MGEANELYLEAKKLEKDITKLKELKLKYENMNLAINTAIANLNSAKSQNNSFVNAFKSTYSSATSNNLTTNWANHSLHIEKIIQNLEKNAIAPSTEKISKLTNEIEVKTFKLNNIYKQINSSQTITNIPNKGNNRSTPNNNQRLNNRNEIK